MNKIYILPRKTDAYGFVKQIAAQKYNIGISALEIERNTHGKPYFKNLDNFYFNISHSSDLLTIAISDCEVGIDIEKLRTPDLRVAKRFCDDEQTYIAENDSQNRFFEVWTKKEAYLKYKGTGLSGGLDSFSIFKTSNRLTTYTYKNYIFSVCADCDFEIINKA